MKQTTEAVDVEAFEKASNIWYDAIAAANLLVVATKYELSDLMPFLPEILLGHDEEFLRARREHIRFIAIHEASHAVAYVCIGSKVRLVSIQFRRDEGSDWEDGRTELWPDLIRPNLRNRLMATAAGIIGETKGGSNAGQKADEQDFADMKADCAEAGRACDPALFAQAYLDAWALVEDESMWAAISEVADRLVEETRLEGPIIHEIVKKHAKGKSF